MNTKTEQVFYTNAFMVGPDNWKLLISSYLKTDDERLTCVRLVLSMLHFVVLLYNLYLKNKVICQKTVNCFCFLMTVAQIYFPLPYSVTF